MKRTASKATAKSATPSGDIRTGLAPATIARAFLDNLSYLQARFPSVATRNDHYMALAYTVRERLLQRWIRTAETYLQQQSRTVCYLSAEFLMGPQLGNNLINLGIYEEVREAMRSLGLDLQDLLDQEAEPGLGNGGLGRLAACFLDSLATLEIPSFGYGIRYEFGIFDQDIRNGWQVELTDKWLHFGNPWEIPRPEITFDVKFGGRTEGHHDADGNYRVRWIPHRVVRGMAYDTPVLGYKVNSANLLRLWKAEASESFDFHAFNTGDYYGAVMEKMVSENITKVLYPNDESPQGKQLRLQQQYFFASCALQDMLRLYFQRDKNFDGFHKKFAVQLNDTHPAIAVAELMRLLVDEHQVEWEPAWAITQKTFGYTNHTLLPEALERWSVPLFAGVLPRHLEIIYEINRRFLDEVRLRFPNDDERLRRMSLIDEAGDRYVRMANLACAGSHSINGVARLHSDLLKEGVLRDFYEFTPEKFNNKTNGVTPRRFLVLSNPRLTDLITSKIGDGWIKQTDQLRQLEKFAEDPEFQREWRAIKLANKRTLAQVLHHRIGVELNPDSLFDIQVKRLHEYKRQHLNVLHIITLYNRLRHNSAAELTPRTFIFGGKAAPGYFMAKLIIKLINSVAQVVNNDVAVRDRLKVAFYPNFNVKSAHKIYPAADLSEQISTAGKEASGTGNMKFTMNGALTIGTLDGANIEIRDEVGHENFFLFGLTTPEVNEARSRGYSPWDYYNGNPALKEVLDQIHSGFFSPEQPDLFHSLVDHLLHHDTYMLLADYASYIACQDRVGEAYRDTKAWTRMSILNVARVGYFSSDRTIREYCQDIWKVSPVSIELGTR
ncbi:MAG: glycogen/starch/alpha-glucan phosphorylase [Verrucomicrobia bacterium]|nr:glycogen/starch/alpha-glucan phosphorylase [Verrucomicrobiota bacterium]